MAVLHKFVYRSYEIPIKKKKKKQALLQKQILKFIYKYKGPRIAKTVFQENKVKRLTFPEFKIHYKTTAIKTL